MKIEMFVRGGGELITHKINCEKLGGTYYTAQLFL